MQKSSVSIIDSNFLSLQGLKSIVSRRNDLQLIHVQHQTYDLTDEVLSKTDISIINISNEPIEACKLAFDLSKHTTVLVIADTKYEELIHQLWAAGISGILTDQCSEEEISKAIDHLSSNQKFYCNTILDVIGKTGSKQRFDLSKRELQVLTLIVKGKSSKQISEILFLSQHTINSHRKNILKKLGLKSPTELIIFAIDNGLISIS